MRAALLLGCLSCIAACEAAPCPHVAPTTETPPSVASTAASTPDPPPEQPKRTPAETAIRACEDCRSDSKCVNELTRRIHPEDMREWTGDEQAKYMTCIMTAALGAAMEDLARAMDAGP